LTKKLRKKTIVNKKHKHQGGIVRGHQGGIVRGMRKGREGSERGKETGRAGIVHNLMHQSSAGLRLDICYVHHLQIFCFITVSRRDTRTSANNTTNYMEEIKELEKS